MLGKVFVSWLSEKVSFIRGLAWGVAGFAFGVKSIALGFVLLAVALLVNLLCHWLERRKAILLSSPLKKPSKAQKTASNDMFQDLLTSYFASALKDSSPED